MVVANLQRHTPPLSCWYVGPKHHELPPESLTEDSGEKESMDGEIVSSLTKKKLVN